MRNCGAKKFSCHCYSMFVIKGTGESMKSIAMGTDAQGNANALEPSPEADSRGGMARDQAESHAMLPVPYLRFFRRRMNEPIAASLPSRL